MNLNRKKSKRVVNKPQWTHKEELIRNTFYYFYNKASRPVSIPTDNLKLMSYYSTHLANSFNQGKNMWLMKVTQYNRGFGIEIFSNLLDFCTHLKNFKTGYREKLENILPEKQKFQGTFEDIILYFLHLLLLYLIYKIRRNYRRT